MASNGIIEVTDASFEQEVLKSEAPVLIDFWAPWCGPCKAIAPIVDELASAYSGRVKITKMNIDQNSATPSRFGVRGIPTLLVFKGGQVKEQIVGFVEKEKIEAALTKHLGWVFSFWFLVLSREKPVLSFDKNQSPASAGLFVLLV
jgi:thioredoxin